MGYVLQLGLVGDGGQSQLGEKQKSLPKPCERVLEQFLLRLRMPPESGMARHTASAAQSVCGQQAAGDEVTSACNNTVLCGLPSLMLTMQ